MSRLTFTDDEYDFDGDTFKIVLDVRYECSAYYGATGPTFNSPGEPAEGGEIEEIEVTLKEAWRDGDQIIPDGFLHNLIERTVKKQCEEGGPLIDAIEQKIYEEPPEDDDY